jgi:hypothetical protein
VFIVTRGLLLLDSTAYQDFCHQIPGDAFAAAIEQLGQACPQTMSAVMGEGLKPLTVR